MHAGRSKHGATALVAVRVARLVGRASGHRNGERDQYGHCNEGVDHGKNSVTHQYVLDFSAAFSTPAPAAFTSAPAPATVLQPTATTTNPSITNSAAILFSIVVLLFSVLHESTNVDEMSRHGGGD